MAEPLRVVDDVDLDYFPASNRERHDREQISLGGEQPRKERG
jgi:hypothetical protein